LLTAAQRAALETIRDIIASGESAPRGIRVIAD
jgi:uncharacterized protein YoaH (UPF0181 family)